MGSPVLPEKRRRASAPRAITTMAIAANMTQVKCRQRARSVMCVTAIVRAACPTSSPSPCWCLARARTCRRCSTPCTGARRRSWRSHRASPACRRSSVRMPAPCPRPCSPAPSIDRAARDAALADWLERRGARLVVLAGYMELLGAPFLSRFAGAVINVHPSLLPAFPGLAAIEQALAYGVKVFGVTVHFVDAGVDSGAVILQRAVELPAARTPEEVRAALRPLEHELLPRAVSLFARGALAPDAENPRHIAIAGGEG